jgi:uncharacterized RDD family membrane protein YckC
LNNPNSVSNPYAAPKAAVSDISGTVDAEPAGRGARLGAALLDGLIGSLLVYGPFLLLGGMGAITQAAQNPQADPTAALAIYTGLPGLGLLIGFVVWAAITIVLVKRNGQTVGKKLIGIKVVRSDASPIGLGRIFLLRNLVPGLIAAIPLVGLVFILVDHLMIFSEKRQCLHDRIADSIVVRA